MLRWWDSVKRDHERVGVNRQVWEKITMDGDNLLRGQNRLSDVGPTPQGSKGEE